MVTMLRLTLTMVRVTMFRATMLRLTMQRLQWMKGGRWLVVGSRPSRAGGYPLSIKSVPATAQGQQSDSCEERVGLPGLQSNLLRCFSSAFYYYYYHSYSMSHTTTTTTSPSPYYIAFRRRNLALPRLMFSIFVCRRKAPMLKIELQFSICQCNFLCKAVS